MPAEARFCSRCGLQLRQVRTSLPPAPARLPTMPARLPPTPRRGGRGVAILLLIAGIWAALVFVSKSRQAARPIEHWPRFHDTGVDSSCPPRIEMPKPPQWAQPDPPPWRATQTPAPTPIRPWQSPTRVYPPPSHTVPPSADRRYTPPYQQQTPTNSSRSPGN